jgi:elongation factor Ts
MSQVDNVSRLREITGAGVMECKKALDEAQGDFEKARQIIHEKGLAKIEKRADRETGAGMIISYVHNDRIGALLDLRAETDFVVRSEPFKELAKEIVMQIAAMNPQNVDELLNQPYIKNESKTIKDLIDDVRARVGENIKINNFARLEI